MSDRSEALGAERAAWRARVSEDVLWPDQRICDCHHHLWGHSGDEYFAAEFAADIGDGHNVVQTVYVECGSAYRESGPPELAPVGETEFVVQQEAELLRALGRPVITGIIGFADLCSGPALEDVLNAHIEAAGGRFSGVRHSTAWDSDPDVINHDSDPPPHLLVDARFVDGVRVLGSMDLTYDAWIFHRQLPDIIELARAAPETTIVLDHLGGPLGVGPYAGRRAEVLAYCRPLLTELAAAPNIRIKLGGIGMTTYGNRWHHLPTPPDSVVVAEAWGDHIRWCIDAFGPDRAMFESNFPPDHRSCNYRTLWNAFKRIAEPYNQAERDLLFHDTAAQVYKL